MFKRGADNAHGKTKANAAESGNIAVKSDTLGKSDSVFKPHIAAKPEIISNDVEIPISITELASGNTPKGGYNKHGAELSPEKNSDKNADKNVISINSEALASSASGANSAIDALSENSETPDGMSSINSPQAKAAEAIEHLQKSTNAFSRVDNEAVIRQIMDKMQHAVRNGVQEIRMVLRPEALGEVRMSIRVEGDVVFARMQVENSQVKAIVESQFQALKDSLEQQNLQTGSLSVDVRSDSDKSNGAWKDMIDALKANKNRDGDAEDADSAENDGEAVNIAGSDTGRRFGNNTFEYFF
jgi:flagellar hook-length control protein FliK